MGYSSRLDGWKRRSSQAQANRADDAAAWTALITIAAPPWSALTHRSMRAPGTRRNRIDGGPHVAPGQARRTQGRHDITELTRPDDLDRTECRYACLEWPWKSLICMGGTDMCWVCDHPGSTGQDYLEYLRGLLEQRCWIVIGVQRDR